MEVNHEPRQAADWLSALAMLIFLFSIYVLCAVVAG